MKPLLTLLALLIPLSSHAYMKKVVGDKLDSKDKSAINMNFQELEQRLSNKRDSRQDIGSSSNPVDRIYVDSATITNLNSVIKYKVGTFTSAGSISTQTVTGVGFKPRVVLFTIGVSAGGDSYTGTGAMSADGSQWAAATTNSATSNSLIYCIRIHGYNAASFVSMDTDGFSIYWTNVDTGAQPINYIAFQ